MEMDYKFPLVISEINKNVTSMTNNERYEWLTNPLTPSPQFKFPLNLEGKKNRSFQATWLKQYPLLVYSKKLDGWLCKVCIRFGRGEGVKVMENWESWY